MTVPMTVSKVSANDSQAIYDYAAKLNVGLHNFSANVVPTKEQIDHAAKFGQDLVFSYKTNLSHQSPKKGLKAKTGVARDIVHLPFVPTEVVEQLVKYLNVYQMNTQAGSPLRHVDTNTIATVGKDTITCKLANGQELTIKVTLTSK